METTHTRNSTKKKKKTVRPDKHDDLLTSITHKCLMLCVCVGDVYLIFVEKTHVNNNNVVLICEQRRQQPASERRYSPSLSSIYIFMYIYIYINSQKHIAEDECDRSVC